MKKAIEVLSNGVQVTVNRVDEVLASDFDISKHHVGTDFLELKKPLENGHYVELSVWAYKEGLVDEDFGEHLELQIGIRDENDEIENHIHEDFEPGDFVGRNINDVIFELSERMSEVG